MHVSERRDRGDHLRREVRCCEAGQQDKVVYWDLTGPADALPSPLERHDLGVIACLFQAMREAADIHVHGPVSADLLDRVVEFIQIWSLWRPDLYAPIRVTSAEEVSGPRGAPNRRNSAVCAFSGGVDATYTVWNHHSGLAGRTARRIRTAVLIQGFDIPLTHDEAFGIVSRASEQVLADINVPLTLLRTNWRQATQADWEMEFGLGLVSCLAQWDGDVDNLLVGSCEDYGRLVVPWGSHPLPTRLLAGEDSRIGYDGGHLTRTGKIKAISDWEVGFNSLRVCWQGDITGKNCGVCEKCVRTKMNAIAAAVPVPASLGRKPTFMEVASKGPFNDVQRSFMIEILDEAARNEVDDPLLKAVRVAIRRSDVANLAKRALGERGRTLVKGLLKSKRAVA